VLVASDFHLGPGRDVVTKTCVATENFLADNAFAAWLEHHRAEDTLLILNGDIFDVLRVAEVPRNPGDYERWSRRLGELGEQRTAEALEAGVTKSERRYGLQTHDYKTVWKLIRTAEGHPEFFDALGAWVRDGGRVLFITGNHDVEMHWPLVRQWVRLEISERGAGAAAAECVAFEDAHVRIDNLHVEHGHQHEQMTRVDGPPTLPPPSDDQINLPLGSFVNRYIINQVEALDPFIDNVKPVQRSLLRLARQRPLKILTTYFGAWKFLLRALKKRRVNKAVLLIALGLSLPALAPLLLLAIPSVRETVLDWLPFGDVGDFIAALLSGGLLTAVLPWALGVLSELRRKPPADHQHDAASRIAATGADGRPFCVCMGHTHVTAVKRIDGADDRLLFNTGTWIALWPRDRPDLMGRRVYSYVRFDATGADGYRGTALEWDPSADRPCPATILVPAAA
jgi:UDP-2,3-diacylglucosamine pyrophosphatase LpxH